MILLRKKIVTHLYPEAQYHYTSLVVENVMGLGNIHTSTALLARCLSCIHLKETTGGKRGRVVL